jgi:hypothetical protein
VCSSCITTRNPNFQQLAKDKKLNPNQWEVHLIEFKFCEDTRPDPQLQKAKAQHSILIANLNRQEYREVKLHVILVGVMGTIYKDYTDKSALLEQHTNTTFQTLMGIEDDCHMEHQGQGLPQCSQQKLAKRTCQRNP